MKVNIPSRLHQPEDGSRPVLLPAVEVDHVEDFTIETAGVRWMIRLRHDDGSGVEDGRVLVERTEGMAIVPRSAGGVLLEPRGTFAEHVIEEDGLRPPPRRRAKAKAE